MFGGKKKDENIIISMPFNAVGMLGDDFKPINYTDTSYTYNSIEKQITQAFFHHMGIKKRDKHTLN